MDHRPSLLLLLLLVSITAALTIGLTYLPCYSSFCSEDYYAYSTRLHIAFFHALLASTGSFLLLRNTFPSLHRLSTTHLTPLIPIVNLRVSLGAALLGIWTVGLTLATTGFWYEPLHSYWARRATSANLHWPAAVVRLTVTGIIGHHADIPLGLLLIPVGRDSLLGRAFALHQHTLLLAHKLFAYITVIAALAHGAAYYAFVGSYAAARGEGKDQFHVDNPGLTVADVETRRGGVYYLACLPTGMLSFMGMLLLVATSLPAVRRKSYNLFYYTHVGGSASVFFLVSLHASTNFYFLLPGLVLWILDWAVRVLGRGGDRKGWRREVTAMLHDAGNGWYRITLPVSTMSEPSEKEARLENGTLGLAHPIQSYNLNIPAISRFQTHAFTAASVGTPNQGPVFLFQRSQGKAQGKLDKEWTWKLGALAVTGGPSTGTAISLRLEGPYIPPSPGLQTASTIICIVGGTGITGALSLAHWYLSRQPPSISHFHLVWTVRSAPAAELREWHDLQAHAQAQGVNTNLHLHLHVSSSAGRLSPGATLHDILRADVTSSTARSAGPSPCQTSDPRRHSAWVYVSGPRGLLSAAESACLEVRRELRAASRERRDSSTKTTPWSVETLEWHVAKWEV
ncbi:hypothetical protein F5Y15DRAFT_39706 [Xylariaceae sp. FL0016]|nr:hypothetical protein F5Y15DRAFT_39706 [Xylariaceae sp. FL0016]